MPQRIRLIGKYGNLAAAAIFALGVFGTLTEGNAGLTLALVALCALAAFNVYVIERSARMLSEEEWLRAEVRKAELREQLAALEERHNMPEKNGPA